MERKIHFSDAPVSPCINVCQLDARTGLCRGCYRTLDEISVWSEASDNDKRLILESVVKRREEFCL